MLLRSRQVEVDSLIYDLEDSVPAGKKLEARSNVLEILQSPRETKSEQLVRVNSPKTEYGLDDLLAVVSLVSYMPVHMWVRDTYTCAICSCPLRISTA